MEEETDLHQLGLRRCLVLSLYVGLETIRIETTVGNRIIGIKGLV